MKYIISLLLSASALFGFGECDTCAKVPLSVPVDFSKKGTVYETDFQAPWNIWGSLVSFELSVSYFFNSNITSYSQLTSEQEEIDSAIRTGYMGSILIPKRENQYFKIKITLTPLGWASDDLTVISNLNNGWLHRKENHFTKGQKIEEIVFVPLYGGDLGTGKMFVIADLQRLRNYHVRIESLEDVKLPKGVSTRFIINRFSSKH
ncbi:MAG: hypothetical protein PHO27_12370 [Sulfuricurvum sp.]|nr:hypothetical protein [Sulfuricurvum sp.]